jgi:hypothetical protein
MAAVSRGTFSPALLFDDCLDVSPAQEQEMIKTFGCAAIAVALVVITAPADAKGCIKGALVGGVAGHFAGHHGVLGAAAGCAIGHHEANKPKNTQSTTTGSAQRTARK